MTKKNYFPASAASCKDGNFAILGEKILIRINDQHQTDGYVLINEEDILLSNDRQSFQCENNFKGTITTVSHSSNVLAVTVDEKIIFHSLFNENSLPASSLKEGNPVWIHFNASAVRFIPA